VAEANKTSNAPASTKAPAKSSLQPASESGDPAVHQLLAEMQTHRMNGDDAKVKDVERRLAELGYR